MVDYAAAPRVNRQLRRRTALKLNRIQLLIVALACAVAVCAAVWVGAGTTGTVSGVVNDTNGAPMPGANIIISGTDLSTVADAQGRFVITGVPPGEYEIKAEMIGFAAQTVGGVQVVMDTTAEVSFGLEVQAIEETAVVVTRPRPMINPGVTNTLNLVTGQQEPLTRLDPASIRTAPGILGTLPGVIVDPNGSGQVHLRGGRADQVGWYIEGIPITDPNTGVFGTNLFTTGVNVFQVYTGGFGAEYGNAISGVLNEVIKTGANSRGLNMNIENGNQGYSDAFVELGGGQADEFNYYIGSTLQRTDLDGPTVKDQEYDDNVVKLVWPSKKQTISVLAAQGTLSGRLSEFHDLTNLDLPAPHEKDYMHQRYAIGAVSLTYNPNPKSFITIRPYHLFTAVAHNAMGGSLGLPYYLDAWSERNGLQAIYNNKLNDRHTLKLGASVLSGNNNYYIYASMPGYGVIPSYNYLASTDTLQRDFYVEDSIKMAEKWNLSAGLRNEGITYKRQGDQYVSGAGYTGAPVGDVSESRTTPRLGLSFAPNDRTAWKLSWGKYIKFVPAQSVQKIYFSPDDPMTEASYPGLGATAPQRSTSAEISYEKQLTDTLALRVSPFYTLYENLGDTYTDSNGISTFTNLGEGKSRGVEVYLRKKMSNRWQGWLSYTYQKAKSNRADMGLFSDMFYTSWDQTQTLALVTDYRSGRCAHTLRADCGSGRADSALYDPTLQQRAEPYVVVSYNLSVGLGKDSSSGQNLYLGIANLFNSRQTLQYRWDPDGSGGFTRIRDSWVPRRFISFGFSKAY